MNKKQLVKLINSLPGKLGRHDGIVKSGCGAHGTKGYNRKKEKKMTRNLISDSWRNPGHFL